MKLCRTVQTPCRFVSVKCGLCCFKFPVVIAKCLGHLTFFLDTTTTTTTTTATTTTTTTTQYIGGV